MNSIGIVVFTSTKQNTTAIISFLLYLKTELRKFALLVYLSKK
jgi:hypothetical protein